MKYIVPAADIVQLFLEDLVPMEQNLATPAQALPIAVNQVLSISADGTPDKMAEEMIAHVEKVFNQGFKSEEDREVFRRGYINFVSRLMDRMVVCGLINRAYGGHSFAGLLGEDVVITTNGSV